MLRYARQSSRAVTVLGNALVVPAWGRTRGQDLATAQRPIANYVVAFRLVKVRPINLFKQWTGKHFTVKLLCAKKHNGFLET